MVIGFSILIGKSLRGKMAIPDWLKTVTRDELQVVNIKKPRERFLDKTLRHIVSFVEDTIMKETICRSVLSRAS